MSELDFEDIQRTVCVSQGCEFVKAPWQDTAGVALATLGMKPINGLRHPIAAGTTGWYIWCGDVSSDASDFFHPLCIDHLVGRLPAVVRLLGLPPGYRFLI